MKKKVFLPDRTRNSSKLILVFLSNLLPTFSTATGENRSSIVDRTDHNRPSCELHNNPGLTVQQQDMVRDVSDSMIPNIALNNLKLDEMLESLKTE